MPQTFQCTVVTPQQQVFDEQVTYAMIPAWDGKIGLAPQRAPLLVKLGDGALRLDFAQGGSHWYFLAGGFAQMKDNRLTLLTDQAVPAEDIVRSDAEAAFHEAQARVAISDDHVQQRHRDLERARVMIDLVSHHRNAG